jgi:hypothetical protein
MKHCYAFGVFVLLIQLVIALPGTAQMCLVQVELADRLEQSAFVFEGEVTDKTYSWDIHGGNIYTVNVVKVLNVLKGNVIETKVNLLTRGGIVNDIAQIDHPSLILKIGQTGLFFTSPTELKIADQNLKPPFYKPEFSALGFVSYNMTDGTASDALNQYDSVIRDVYGIIQQNGFDLSQGIAKMPQNLYSGARAITINSFSPTSITAGTQSQLTINGSGFGSHQGNGIVEFAWADAGGQDFWEPLSSEYISWSNTQIIVEVPSRAGTGNFRISKGNEAVLSGSELIVPYNLSNVQYQNDPYRLNLVDADESGGLLFEFNTEFFNNSEAYEAFIRGLNSWRCSNSGGTGVYFENGGSISNNSSASDNINVVSFDTGLDPLPSNVLGRTTSFYLGCSNGTAVNWFLEEVDMIFNDVPANSSYSWNFDEADNSTGFFQFDFESVALHELGHAHQIGHSINDGNVMFYAIANSVEIRDLDQNDLDAGDDVLSFSQGVCGKNAMQPDYICASLPVEIVAVKAETKGLQGIQVLLELESQSNPALITLERSIDAFHFEKLKSIEPELRTEGNQIYSFVDDDPFESNYYRFLIIDEDGLTKYSEIVVIHFPLDQQSEQYFYPNPVSDLIHFNRADLIREVKIYDFFGKTLYLGNEVNTHLDVSWLPEGIYVLEVISGNDHSFSRLVKE